MKTVLVVHVPKAAGTTLRWIMDRQYPSSQVFTIGNDIPAERERLEAMPDKQKRRLKAVFGHQCWGWHEALAEGQGFQYVTILRDPVERVLSTFAYCRIHGHYLKDAIEGMDLREFLTSGVTRTCDNGMVRQLCGQDRFLREPYFDMALPFDGVTDRHLTQAMRNLQKCAVVGVAERFDDMLDRCRRLFGWRISWYENQNVTRWERPDRATLDRASVMAVNRCNKLDQQLYEFAKELA